MCTLRFRFCFWIFMMVLFFSACDTKLRFFYRSSVEVPTVMPSPTQTPVSMHSTIAMKISNPCILKFQKSGIWFCQTKHSIIMYNTNRFSVRVIKEYAIGFMRFPEWSKVLKPNETLGDYLRPGDQFHLIYESQHRYLGVIVVGQSITTNK